MKVHLQIKNWRGQTVCGKFDPPLTTEKEEEVTCKVCLSYMNRLKERGLRAIYKAKMFREHWEKKIK